MTFILTCLGALVRKTNIKSKVSLNKINIYCGHQILILAHNLFIYGSRLNPTDEASNFPWFLLNPLYFLVFFSLLLFHSLACPTPKPPPSSPYYSLSLVGSSLLSPHFIHIFLCPLESQGILTTLEDSYRTCSKRQIVFAGGSPMALLVLSYLSRLVRVSP